MGYLYQPKLKSGKSSAIYWCKYYVNGRPVRESTGAVKEKAARDFLKAREGRVATGQPILPRVDRIRYEEIAADLRKHYETTGCRDLDEVGGRLAHLDGFFAGRRVVSIAQPETTDYALKRQGQRASNSTINRELAVLIRMLRLAYENGKLLRLPVIRKLKEAPPRSGFFEREQYLAVRRRLPEDLQVAVAIAYTFGWRMRSEALSLELRHVDLEAGTLRLDPGMTKNDEGRLVYLPPELKAQVAAQVERVREWAKRKGAVPRYLFTHLRGRFEGTRIGEFKRAWATACRKAGVAGMLRHDFRRTAVRNMVNAGVPERVAMTVTGHKTRAVFDRYHIVSPGDLQEVARRLGGADGHVFGHVRPPAVDSRPVSR